MVQSIFLVSYLQSHRAKFSICCISEYLMKLLKLSDNFRQLLTKSNVSGVEGGGRKDDQIKRIHCTLPSASSASVYLCTLLDIRHDILPRRFHRKYRNWGSTTPALGPSCRQAERSRTNRIGNGTKNAKHDSKSDFRNVRNILVTIYYVFPPVYDLMATGTRGNRLVAKSVCSLGPRTQEMLLTMRWVLWFDHMTGPWSSVTQWGHGSVPDILLPRTPSKPGDNNGNWSANLLILTACNIIGDQLWVIATNLDSLRSQIAVRQIMYFGVCLILITWHMK